MSRSSFLDRGLSARPPVGAALAALGALLGLGLAVGAALLLTQLLMSPPSDQMRLMAGYLTLAGAVTLAGGWLALQLADRVLGLSIRAKAFLSAAISGGVALLNVVIVAELMFVSTSHDLKLLVALVAFSAAITALFGLWVATTVAGRLESVAEGIRRLASGDYSSRVDLAGGDEVARLAVDVNRLAERLRGAEAQRDALDRERRELTAAVSHDLRTPLASVRAMTEALADDVVSDRAEVQRYYATMRREIERLSRMIDDLFELAKLDAGALQIETRRVALQDIVAEVVDAIRPQALRRDIDVRLRVEGRPPDLLLDGGRIERAAANILINAVEHTPPGGQVDIAVRAENGCVALRVTDSGEGIDAADLAHIWDRFYRGEKSRRRSSMAADGAGLGLAIARGFIEAHGGTAEVTSSPGRGAAFTVRLPLPSSGA